MSLFVAEPSFAVVPVAPLIGNDFDAGAGAADVCPLDCDGCCCCLARSIFRNFARLFWNQTCASVTLWGSSGVEKCDVMGSFVIIVLHMSARRFVPKPFRNAAFLKRDVGLGTSG